jgi:hypothetical protein
LVHYAFEPFGTDQLPRASAVFADGAVIRLKEFVAETWNFFAH